MIKTDHLAAQLPDKEGATHVSDALTSLKCHRNLWPAGTALHQEPHPQYFIWVSTENEHWEGQSRGDKAAYRIHTAVPRSTVLHTLLRLCSIPDQPSKIEITLCSYNWYKYSWALGFPCVKWKVKGLWLCMEVHLFYFHLKITNLLPTDKHKLNRAIHYTSNS